MFSKYPYFLYLQGLALPLVLVLGLSGWKRKKILANARICGCHPSPLFLLRFYSALVMDLLRFVHGHYGRAISVRSQDAAKLQKLKSGGSLYLTAHFHNWELMGSWLTRQGVPLLSGARPMANPWAQSLLMRFRARLGMQVVFRSMPRQALRHLRQGGCFAFLWDQRVVDPEYTAPLFGRDLLLDPLPSFLVRHHPIPVWFGVLLPGGKWRLVQLADPARSRDPFLKLGRRYHRVLEILVRNHPASWYGLAHGRFQKTV